MQALSTYASAAPGTPFATSAAGGQCVNGLALSCDTPV
jgi:hypothetical protein